MGWRCGIIQAWHELDRLLCPCSPRLWSPDIGLDAHAAILEARVHSEVNGAGSFPTVVLMDQHGVLCNIMAGSIPRQWNTVVDSHLHVTSIPSPMVARVSQCTWHPMVVISQWHPKCQNHKYNENFYQIKGWLRALEKFQVTRKAKKTCSVKTTIHNKYSWPHRLRIASKR